MVCLLFFLIELYSLMFLEVQLHSLEVCPLLQVCWYAASCFWFSFYVIVHIIVIFNLNKFKPIILRWCLFLHITELLLAVHGANMAKYGSLSFFLHFYKVLLMVCSFHKAITPRELVTGSLVIEVPGFGKFLKFM